MNNEPMQTVLVLLRRGNEIALARKLTSHGEGKLNGYGGKILPGETPKQTAIRETRHEAGVTATKLAHVALLHFRQTPKVDEFSDLDCHVFIADEWQGGPVATSEMAPPQWFASGDIPYDQMWSDDALWLPRVLNGETIEADFVFDDAYHLTSHKIRTKS